MAVLGAFPADMDCRPIREEDWEGVIDCLRRGFPQRDRDYWRQAFIRMSKLPAVDDFARYGFLLEKEKTVVGVVLAIYFRHKGRVGDEIRCNMSSWAVDPEFRPYATKLLTAILRQKKKNVTFVNVSPAPATRKINHALGFKRFSNGQFAFFPALGTAQGSSRVLEARPDLSEMTMLSENERYILTEHAALGCLSLLCIRDGKAFPFVFMPRRVLRGLVPSMQVVYCRSLEELSQCAGPIGRFLLRKGVVFCLVDAMESISGLVGRYFPDKGPKYFKGPNPPALGDLTFTELIVFGP